MKKVFHLAWFSVFLFFPLFSYAANDTAAVQIFAPNGLPLKNMPIYIFDGDIESKGGVNELYPYSSTLAKTKMTYLDEVKTDNNGIFQLHPTTYAQKSLVLRAGSIYTPIGLEKSSDIHHTPSEDHLRHIEWNDENGSVKANHIYNWRVGTVVTIPLDGQVLAEKSVNTTPLNTYYIKRIMPVIMPPFSESDTAHLTKQFKQMTYHRNLLGDAHKAMSYHDHNPGLREAAAQYLGRHGDYISVSYLMDEISLGKDAHVKDAAFSALQELTGETFGDDLSIWREWLTERNLAIEKIESYLSDTGRLNLDIYRIHMNKEKTQWGASLQNKNAPDEIGAPALLVDRVTGAINFIKGR